MDNLNTWIVLTIVINVILSLAVSYVASQKGRSPGGFFFLSFFLSFIVGILVVLALPPKSKIETTPLSDRVIERDGEQLVKCPYCAEWVKTEAKVCKHCGRDIEAGIRETLDSLSEEQRRVAEERRLRQDRQRELDELRESERKVATQKALRVGKIVLLVLIPVLLIVGAFFWIMSAVSDANQAQLVALQAEKEAAIADIQRSNLKKPESLDALQSQWTQLLNDCEVGSADWTFSRPNEGATLMLDLISDADGAKCFAETLIGFEPKYDPNTGYGEIEQFAESLGFRVYEAGPYYVFEYSENFSY